jgi:hypothetical protein
MLTSDCEVADRNRGIAGGQIFARLLQCRVLQNRAQNPEKSRAKLHELELVGETIGVFT